MKQNMRLEVSGLVLVHRVFHLGPDNLEETLLLVLIGILSTLMSSFPYLLLEMESQCRMTNLVWGLFR